MIIRPLQIDQLRQKFASADPFPHVCIDDFLDPEFARQVAMAWPSFEEANAWGQRFETVNEHRKVQLTDPNRFAPVLRELKTALHSPGFLNQLSRITGIPDLLADERMLGGGVHQTAAGGRLDVHVDFNYLPDVQQFRRLNLLLYLNPEWHESWGGELELWDRNVTACRGSYPPLLGRCVIFATSNHSYHGTTTVTCPPRITRNSFALYYYTREAPPDFDDDFHGTVFRARPGERLKGNVLMPMEALARRVRYRAQQLVAGVKGLLRGSAAGGEKTVQIPGPERSSGATEDAKAEDSHQPALDANSEETQPHP